MSLYDRSKAEVEDLHRCLLDWCRGRVDDNTAAWERIKRSWAEGFRLADADGLIEGSKRLLDLQVRFNEAVDDPLTAVWVEGFTGYPVAEDLFQAFYEEWRHWSSGAQVGRGWSVLLRSAGDGPHGLQWVHAHRSPLQEEAKPSFVPPEAYGEAAAAPADDDDVSDVPWATYTPPPADEPPAAPAEEVSPLTELRAFFGDAEAQAVAGVVHDYDRRDADTWLRALRKAGPEAALRTGLVVLEHLLEPWEQFFPEEGAPRAIHAGLTRFLAGEAEGLTEARALVEEAADRAAVAKEFAPDPLPDGFRTYVHATNAAEAASRLAEGADGSAVALGVKLAPSLTALSQETLLALCPEVLKALEGV